jgi:hypothetical protein
MDAVDTIRLEGNLPQGRNINSWEYCNKVARARELQPYSDQNKKTNQSGLHIQSGGTWFGSTAVVKDKMTQS